MILIDDLKELNKNNLGTWNIINCLHTNNWNILFFLFAGLNSLLIILPILFVDQLFGYVWFLFYIPAISFTYYLINFTQIKNLSAMQHAYNDKFNLDIQADWNHKTIHQIEYLILLAYFKTKQNNLSKDDIRLIIDSLKFESSQSRYNYQFLGISTTLISVVLGAFLGAFLNLIKDPNELFSFSKILLATSVYILMMISFTELFVIKRIIEFRKNKYQSLIRALENYHINFSFSNVEVPDFKQQ